MTAGLRCELAAYLQQIVAPLQVPYPHLRWFPRQHRTGGGTNMATGIGCLGSGGNTHSTVRRISHLDNNSKVLSFPGGAVLWMLGCPRMDGGQVGHRPSLVCQRDELAASTFISGCLTKKSGLRHLRYRLICETNLLNNFSSSKYLRSCISLVRDAAVEARHSRKVTEILVARSNNEGSAGS